LAIGLPRIAADVADACGLPRRAWFPISFFFTVTIQNCFPASNPARQERGNVAKNTECATKIFKKNGASAASKFASFEQGGTFRKNARLDIPSPPAG
jgi:hypothetical protein